MKLKFYLIIVCLLIFGCKNNGNSPTIIEKTGELALVSGVYKLYTKEGEKIWENGLKTFGVYDLWGKDEDNFFGPYIGKNVKVIGEEAHYITELTEGRKRYDLTIVVHSIELVE